MCVHAITRGAYRNYQLTNVVTIPAVCAIVLVPGDWTSGTLHDDHTQDLSSTKSWQARLLAYRNGNQMTGSGWKSFCCENEIKVGDVCTIKLIEPTLWHVIIER